MDVATIPQKASRQCWECLKRRIVCDYALPSCKKCIKKGKECPGYDSKKPLQWLEPGKVTSRKRTKPSKKSQLVIPLHPRHPVPQLADAESHTSSPIPLIRNEEAALTMDEAEELQNLYMNAIADAQSVDDVDRLVQFASQTEIEEIVKSGLEKEAKKFLRIEKDPMEGLKRILRFMRQENLPAYNLLSDTCEVVQTIQYFNARIIPEAKGPENALVPNPQIMFFPLSALHLLTPSTHSSFVCIALYHYILRLPSGAKEKALVMNAPKIWQYRGEALRELIERVSNPKTMYSFTTITSLLVFLTNELQAQTLKDWRTHVDVLIRIMKTHGGPMELYRSAFYMHPTIVLFQIVITFCNSTSPACDQVVLAPTLKEELENVEEFYHELFPYCLCPPNVFFYIIRINYLRREASQALLLEDNLTSLSTSATELLSEIEAFSVDDWAQPGNDNADWLTIGSAFKHAAVIYCIMSMQSLNLLPLDAETKVRLEIHGDLLATHLKRLLAVQRIRRYANWPLVVAGVEAGYRGETRRKWVEDGCTDLSRFLGTNCPLTLKAELRRYWSSGNLGWEQCFQEPYAFLF